MRARPLAALIVLAVAPLSDARPTHTDIRPLAPTETVDGITHYFPPDLGKVWTYRIPDAPDHQIRYVMERAATVLSETGRSLMKTFTLVRYALDPGKEPRELRRDVLHWTDEGVVVVGARRGTDAAGAIGERLGVEMPERVTAASTWDAGGTYRVAGLADVTTEAGSWSDCLAVDTASPDGTDRRFWCAGVGMALATGTDKAERWHPVLELVNVVGP